MRHANFANRLINSRLIFWIDFHSGVCQTEPNMKAFLPLLITLLLLGFQDARGSSVDVSTTVTNEIEVCHGSEIFEVVIKNDSTNTLTNVAIQIALPTGIEYALGSLNESTSHNVQEQIVSQSSSLLFTADNLPAGDSILFTISFNALQPAIAFQDGGGIFRNTTTVSYAGGAATDESDSYNILYPALSILSVSPNATTILSGNTVTRTVSIINGGNGKTDAVYITDFRNASTLTLNGTNLGTLSGDTIIVSGSDFSSFGNGDNYLDQNESFTITQTLSGTSCSDETVTSSINAWCGCNGDLVSTATSYGNVSIDFQSPRLQMYATDSLTSCFGAGLASPQELKIVNTGSGIASAISVTLFKSTGGNYNQDIFTRFDPASLQYKVGASGTNMSVNNITTNATKNTGDYACLGANPIGQMQFILGNIQPGDTVYVAWDMYSCCVQTCSDEAVKGWKSELSYTDICNTTPYAAELTGQGVNSHYMTFTSETPADINSGQEEEYTFIVSSHANDLPEGSGAGYKATFTLDAGLSYESMKFHSNNLEWMPASVNVNGNTVEAMFPLPAPFTIAKSEINLALSGSCGASGWKTIELDMAYVPDPTCISVCEIPLECDYAVTTYLHCPLASCEGLKVLSFDAQRTNFGAPDNDLNGLADVNGALNMDKVKANRAMTGDTILASISSVIESNGNNWDYAGFTSSIDFGSVLSFIEAELIIYDASAATSHTVTGLAPNINTSSQQRDFSFDLSSASIAAQNTSLIGYAYGNGDSVWVNVKYRVADNVSGLLKETTFLNELYVSEVANPSSAQKDNCNVKNGRFTLIGYQWRNDAINNVTVNACSKNVDQYFGMSIGDLSSNYGGGNLFPYEHRPWGELKEAWLVLPPNYQHVNTVLKQWRTKQTNATTVQTLSAISPDAVSGDTLYFNIEQYYTAQQLAKSDDGFHGRFQVEIAPSCDVPENTYQDVVWLFNYQESNQINGLESGQIAASSNDRVRYHRSNIEISSTNPWQDANTRSVVWNYRLKNTSSSGADNAWVHLVPPTNLVIDSVVNDNTGQALVLQGDIYPVGKINGNGSVNLSIHGTFTNCDNVLINTYAGYECTGYPSSFSSFTCPFENYNLYVEPKPSAYQTRISTVLQEDPCSPELDLVVDITSVKTAHMYDMSIDYITNDTQKIKVKNGSSAFQYNTANPYSSVADPSYDGNAGSYGYDINDYDASFAANGIPGVLDIANNRYRLKSTLELGNGFSNGDFIQVRINGANACNVDLPTINLAVDPSIRFAKDNTAGLHTDVIDSWSASWGDYDNDGYDDLFVPSKDVNGTNILYHNNQNGTFSKVTTGAIVTDLGAAVSGTWGDYDNDGDVDLFVSYMENGANKLYRNNGDGTFTGNASAILNSTSTYSGSASWADYNKDGNLDLVVSDFHPTHFNFLYYGDGEGGFTVDENSVISQSATSAVGAAWGDYDDDGDVDLFIANTNGENNQLFQNNAGLFTEITAGSIVNDGGHSVGGTWGDYDNDGDLDLFVTNSTVTEANFFYENDGDGTFTKITTGLIVTDFSNSHGASWIDYDNDGDLDLTVANDQGANNFLYANNGDKTFTKLTNAISDQETDAYGTSWSDFDNDGDYDLYVANRGNTTNDFFINEKGSCTNHIVFKLAGCNSNRDGIGAKIRVKATIDGASLWQTKYISTQTSGMAGQNSNKLLFGLKDASSVDSVIIKWPSGITMYMTQPTINQIHTINEDCAPKVCGFVFNDQNENGVQDKGERGVPNASITVTPGDFQIYTDDLGYYQFFAADGSYTLSLESDLDWSQTLPALGADIAVQVDQSVAAEYCGNDFGINALCDYPDLKLSLGTTAFRRGLTNMLNVVVTNEGGYDAIDSIDVAITMTDNVTIQDLDWMEQVAPIGFRKYTKTFSGLDQLSDTVFELTDSVAVNATLGEMVTVEGKVTYGDDECDTTNNAFSMTDIVVGSIDPNDKSVLVQDVGASEVAFRNDRLIYKIRFENVGTYPARIVRIVDELSPDLDWSTFSQESSSHPFSVSVVDGVVQWVNRNIELPDSASDPEGSQGYITFSIRPRQGIDIYTLIENDAQIQFDYNDFIQTNNTKIYVKPVDFTPVVPVVTVYPNPASEYVNVMLVGTDKALIEMNGIEILDVSGMRVLQQTQLNLYKHNININHLNAGVYIVKVRTGNRSYSTRLVVL